MRSVKIARLEPGMVTAETLYNPNNGTVLLPEKTILTDKTIAWLDTLQISALNVEGDLAPEELRAPDPATIRIRASAEFKRFERDHEKAVNLYTASINDFVLKNKSFEPKRLVKALMNLVSAKQYRFNILEMLSNLKSYDDPTYSHGVNVALLSHTFGKWLRMSPSELEILTLAGLLHDVGKIMIPEKILKKPSSLTHAEYEVMKTHTLKGYYKLKNAEVDPRICEAALSHHERADGSGYPYGLKGTQLPAFPSIIGITDVYDAITSPRVYRDPICPFKAIDLFEKEGLQKYDPQYILTFLENVASCYLYTDVLLSDGRTGKVIFINRDHISKPTVQLSSSEYIDLCKTPDVYIEKML